MDHSVIVLSWLGILTAGLFGVYAMGFKIMKDVNRKVGEHTEDTAIHVDPDHPLVTAAVCHEIQKTTQVHLINLAAGQDRIEKQVGLLVEKML